MALFHTTVLDNQIKALPTVDTASGAIATFDTDLTENLVSVKCQIVAKQASGTPSPDNPLPITTFSEMNVVRSGLNIYDFDSSRYFRAFLPQGTKIYAKTDHNSNFNVYVGYKDGTQTSFLIAYGNQDPYEFTCEKDVVSIAFADNVYQTLINNNSYVQYSLVPFTTMTRYNGNTYNIPFGQTVANGVLDITTGKLVITHKAFNLGSYNWNRTTNYANNFFYTGGVNGVVKPSATNTALCEIFNPVANGSASDFSANSSNYDTCFTVGGNQLFVRDDDYTNPTTFKTAINNKYIVFELLNHETIDLNSTQITALLNENNIWCDTGDTEVKYLLTVGKKIS